jgi:transcriptional regulator with XRE-family HTH domain
LTNTDKSKKKLLKTIGQILREFRESKGLLLRQVAAALEMDTALLSKFERDERTPNKEQVVLFARYYDGDIDEMLLAWLSDKIVNEVQDEVFAKEALKAAEKKVELLKKKKKL